MAAPFRTPDAPAEWATLISGFLAHHVAAAGAEGVVVGVSGGLDSAVVAALCVRALGPKRVLAVMLPAPDSNPQDREHAELGCQAIGLEPLSHPIGPIVEGLERTLGYAPEARVRANAKARARMLLLYAEAQRRNYLVCGTGNKSEILTGYFTKHGDGGVDMQPIGDLYKTQVRELGRHLGIPKPILEKPPSAGLYPGQTDEADMGLTYVELDSVLKGMELNQPLRAIAATSGVPAAKVERVEAMVRRSEHKRHWPLVPKVGARTVGIDWRRSVQWGLAS
ncbi:MAG: NAD+ synthase [Thermoplasmatota archaeon]